MTRVEFLAAVDTAWTPASGDPWALAAHAAAFADVIDGMPEAAGLSYESAVVIDGSAGVLAARAVDYDAARAHWEARAGQVTSVMRGADLLAGHIGDRPPVDPVAAEILGTTPGGLVPTDVDLAYLLERGCADLFHARRCFTLLHAGPRSRVNLYPGELDAAITATADTALEAS